MTIDSNLRWDMFASILECRKYIFRMRTEAVSLSAENPRSGILQEQLGRWNRRLSHVNAIVDQFINTLDAEISEYWNEESDRYEEDIPQQERVKEEEEEPET